MFDLFFNKFENLLKVEKMTVAVLKDFLTAEGISGLSKYKKPELVDLVKQQFNL